MDRYYDEPSVANKANIHPALSGLWEMLAGSGPICNITLTAES
jgi:hypothetical protein